MPKIIFLLIFPALLCSCVKEDTSWKSLEHIMVIMDSRPAEALSELDAMNVEELESDKSRAMYGLLKSQALHKNHIFAQEDSLIEASVRYYRKNGPDSLLMRAYYYQGVTQNNGQDYIGAMTAGFKSLDIALQRDDALWLAKGYELMADVCNEINTRDDELKYRNMAIGYYEKAGRKLNTFYSRYDKGSALYNLRRYEDCVEVMDSLLGDIRTCDDYNLRHICMGLMMAVTLEMDSVCRARNFSDSIRALSPYVTLLSTDYSGFAEIEIESGDLLKAQMYIDSAKILSSSCNDSIFFNLADSHKAQKIKDFESACIALEKLLDLQGMEVGMTLEQSVPRAERDYIDWKEKNMRRHARKMRNLLWCIVVCVAALGIGISIYARKKYLKRKSGVEDKMADFFRLEKQYDAIVDECSALKATASSSEKAVNTLSETVSRQKTELSTLKHNVSTHRSRSNELAELCHAIFDDHCSTLNHLCAEFFEKGDSDVLKPALLKEVEKEIKSMTDWSTLSKFEDFANNFHDGIAHRLRQQCAGLLKPADMDFLILIFCGLAPRTICLFSNIKIKNYYARRSRLAERIAKSDVRDKALFLKYIGRKDA